MTHLDGVKDEAAAGLYHTWSYVVNCGHGDDKTVPVKFRNISVLIYNLHPLKVIWGPTSPNAKIFTIIIIIIIIIILPLQYCIINSPYLPIYETQHYTGKDSAI